MSTHSPGPWKWEQAPSEEWGDEPQGRIVDADGKLVCDFGDGRQYYPTEGTPPDGMNRRLILAAPEMFDALKHIRFLGVAPSLLVEGRLLCTVHMSTYCVCCRTLALIKRIEEGQ